ncbi:PTS system trehalose-specific EIIBC component [Vagococcus sp. BWB3-3]|uniref:PTS system sucrose-specific EIIBCA component n=1 Tax=Vagococcus allomyrinae TaxID=2794353 RepID=A0A940SXE5_9ENTE|nr:PTS system trehalose-specific EIIBC component [Vagococcus allomyrinae]MBP1043196.1 PTS system trehalose-specific EIIBC component [Vagococcus allomyrinae]
MADYKNDAAQLLKDIGGKENIAAVSHCATRMRFVLNDPAKADEQAIEDIPVVKGMFTQAGQFQVIIGNDVQTFYNEFVKVSGVEGVSKEAAKQNAKQNQTTLQRIIGVFAEIFSPLIPALVVGGLILGFRNILEGIEFGFLDGQTIVQVSQFWAGTNSFLWLIGEAIFQFLPVGITWSIAKKMGTTQILGIVLGITLVSPQLLNAYSVATTAAGDIPFWDFGFAQVNMIGYQAQVIPAMLAGFLLCYLELFFRKHIPQAISMIFVPLFALVPTVLLAHTVLGPIGWKIGSFISTVVNTGLASAFNWLFAAAFGFFYAPLVITGLHHMTNAIDLQLVADFGSTNLWPMIALSNIAQGSAVMAIIYLHRGNEKEEQVSIPAAISCYLGVTEPAMFGINLKYLYPFVAGMIGSSIAGLFSTLMGVRAASIGVGGLPGILSIKIGYGSFAIAMLIAVVVPFFLTIFFRNKNILNKIDRVGEELAFAGVNDSNLATTTVETSLPTASNTTGDLDLYAPADGELIAITEVNDQVFSKKMLGDGFALRPKNNEIVSPVSGKVTSIFPTKHAIGLLMDNGLEVLVHMGLDTVELKGEPFEILVTDGQSVSPGTPLATMDLDQITALGKGTDIIVVLTNLDDHSFNLTKTGPVSKNDLIGGTD